MQALLEAAAMQPILPVDRLSFVGGAERAMLLHSFNNTELALSELCHPGQTIPGLLEHWAAAAPHAPAAVFEVLLQPIADLLPALFFPQLSLIRAGSVFQSDPIRLSFVGSVCTSCGVSLQLCQLQCSRPIAGLLQAMRMCAGFLYETAASLTAAMHFGGCLPPLAHLWVAAKALLVCRNPMLP